jgi:hypothetical protein
MIALFCAFYHLCVTRNPVKHVLNLLRVLDLLRVFDLLRIPDLLRCLSNYQ